jgi:hypothetical protein
MAQLAIPLLLLGTAYLVSNDDSKKDENFANIEDIEKQKGNLLTIQYDDFQPNDAKTENNTNNSGTYNSYQDKYFMKNHNANAPTTNNYTSLTGEKLNANEMTHNNMTAFFSNNTNGSLNDFNNKSILDSYTGSGTYDIEKNEVAQLFKPSENTQLVYGTQNQNDFLQSRVNQSLRHANSKPWESVQVGPGLNQGYEGGPSELGFNNVMESRDSWKPKTVDELRADNNPKLAYRLDNHMGPALKPVQNAPDVKNMGRIVKKGPDTYFSNDSGTFTGAAKSSVLSQSQKPQQMMTQENRDTTTVSYYGVKGSQSSESQYTTGEYMEGHKQQLPTKPFINMTNNNIYPTSKQNYGKSGYRSYANNRNTTRDGYMGNIFGQLKANVIDPIVDGFRHTKKDNFVSNDHMGNVSGNAKQSIVFNPNEYAPTTNREMYECKVGMDHLNVQNQDATGYISANPYLIGTQRQSMNQDEMGPAGGVHQQFSKSYESVYNQRNNENRVHAKRTNTGNMSLFNNQTNASITGHEACNTRTNALYIPQQNTLDIPIAAETSQPQQYKNIQEDYNSPDMLNAFKSNPYTQPLGAVA